MCVSGMPSKFRNHVVKKVAATLQVEYRVKVVNSAWTNGTVKQVMKEILMTSKDMSNGRRKSLSEEISGVLVVE